MPRGDGTGPRGKGPKTGRGLGRCNPEGRAASFENQGFGGESGQGRGLGKGQGRGLGKGPRDGRGTGSGKRARRSQ